MYIYLELTDDKSAKFWEAHAVEETLTTRWGKIGSEGKEKVDDDFEDYHEAAESALKQASKKRGKGYVDREPEWWRAIQEDEDTRHLLEAEVLRRIVTGDTTDLEDAYESVEEALEACDLDGAAAELYDDDPERMAHATASLLWVEAEKVAATYADKPSDSDALLRAMKSLEDDGVEFQLFSDWPSLEIKEGEPGGALVNYQDWAHLEPDAESTLVLCLGRLGGPVSELEQKVRAALEAEGLHPGGFTRYDGDAEVGEFPIPVFWRWRVEPLYDAED